MIPNSNLSPRETLRSYGSLSVAQIEELLDTREAYDSVDDKLDSLLGSFPQPDALADVMADLLTLANQCKPKSLGRELSSLWAALDEFRAVLEIAKVEHRKAVQHIQETIWEIS